jgi:hypothetical protein
MGNFIFVAGTLIVGAIIRGFVVVKMWEWFISGPLDMPRISIPVAIGISFLVGMFIPTSKEHEISTKDFSRSKFFSVALNALASALLVLFLGWIVHFFI